MRRVRPGTRSRASSRKRGWNAWSRRRRRSRARPATRSRPIAATPSISSGCCSAGKLHPVRVPGPEEEALRDLVRARETLRLDLMRARHRLSKLLLRHGVRFDDGRAWTDRHRDVAGDGRAGLAGGAGDAAATLEGAIDVLVHRRDHLEREIVAILPGSPWATQVGRLRCLRGVDTLTAVGLCAEVGDFERFAQAEQLMSYLGLVPSESTTGEQSPAGVDHQDRIRRTPAGCSSKRPGTTASAPATAQDPHRATSRPTPRRRSRSRGPRNNGCTAPGPGSKQRAKRRTIIAVAAARELVGFCWAITQIE